MLDTTAKILVTLTLIISTVSFGATCYANGSPSEAAAGGIQFKEEKRVAIEREDLYISKEKIEVSYVFKNYSSSDVATEIAFPINYIVDEINGVVADFHDFSVFVNGNYVKIQKDSHAIYKGKDYTDFFRSRNISYEDFSASDNAFLERVRPEDKKRLAELGLIDEIGVPLWTVDIRYCWPQVFPPNQLISIKISYTPYMGSKFLVEDDTALFKEACIGEKEMKWIKRACSKNDERFVYRVAYILTTANNWRQPIKNFHLIVEKDTSEMVSFCFDAEVVKTSPTRFEAYVTDFIPTKDLKVFFFRKGQDIWRQH